MYDAFSRMENLLGTKGVKRLGSAKIAVFGIGGIGSYVVEALARCGVGSLTLVDNEDISLTDINRQLYALRSAIGRKKVSGSKRNIFVTLMRIFWCIPMKHIIVMIQQGCLI